MTSIRPTLTVRTAVVALTIALIALMALRAAPGARADDVRACDPNGVTAQDVAVGQQLNAQLDHYMKGYMGGYQTSCARVVVQSVKSRGFSARAAVIAIATVIVESRLRNVAYGDLDSLGLYQQRVGWGTAAERLHPPTATRKFLDEMVRLYPNNSWTTAPIGEVAADVQRPAEEYRDRYAMQAGDAQLIVNVLWDAGNPSSLPGLSAISRVNGALDVFAATTDGRVKHRNLTDGVWSCWSTLSENVLIKGDPAAVYTPGRIDVFGLGLDNRLKRLTWTTSHGWYPWVDMGADTFTSGPAVTSRSATGIDVFVRNNGNKIVYRHFEVDTGTWTTSWSYIGGNHTSVTVTSGPAAVASVDGARMNIFARDDDGSLLSLMWTAINGWYSWVDRGGHLTGKPTATTRGGGSVDVFVRDHDDSLIHRHSSDGADWSTYPAVDFGGHIYTSPAVVSMSGQRIDVLSRNVEADLVRKAWTATNGWYAWAGHGPIGSPACS